MSDFGNIIEALSPAHLFVLVASYVSHKLTIVIASAFIANANKPTL